MIYDTIRRLPTSIVKIQPGCKDMHESLTRGYQILEKVKWLLQEGSSPAVVLELIAMMEDGLDTD